MTDDILAELLTLTLTRTDTVGGVEYTNSEGQLHRIHGPAVIYPNGLGGWYYHGRLHRENGPAITHPDGSEDWYHHGRRHRSDGPAEIWADGTQCWWLHGRRHRSDGPAGVYPNGHEEWYCHGQMHRVGGPAFTYPNGDRYWYQSDKLHRSDGPAVIVNGVIHRWHLHGEPMSEQQWRERVNSEVDSGGVVRHRNSEGQLHRLHGPAVTMPSGSQLEG